MTEEERALIICSETQGDVPCSECPFFERCKSDQNKTKFCELVEKLSAAIGKFYEALYEVVDTIASEIRRVIDALASTANKTAGFPLFLRTIKSRTKPYYAGKLYKIISALFRPYGAGRFRHAKSRKKEARKV